MAKEIVAVIVPDPSLARGGVPIFVVKDEDERERMAFLLGRIMDAMVHDLGNEIYVLVHH